jgi:indolepyruvate ferredoxin oxidoreductase alpha subunit
VAGGVPYTYVDQVIRELGLEEEVSVLKIGAYPIPEAVIADFLASVESVLVVEELTPFIEDEVTLSAFRNQKQIPILGKHSGHFPEEYEYSPDLVEDAVREYLQMESRPKRSLSVPDLPGRPPVLCAGCSHRTSFYLTRKVFGKKTVYCNDIGCYTLGYGEPLESCDTVLCMGSSISQASGIARTTGERTVAYIGDSTFFHSGLPALVNAVQANDPITVVILNNYVTGMTGFQPSPTLHIEDAVRGLGVGTVLSADPFDEELALDALKTAKAGDGTNVVVFNSTCVVNEAKLGVHEARPAYEVDPELCNSCSLCVRVLGCPAIFVEDGRYIIDAELCDGCDLCANVCTRGAIHAATDHVHVDVDVEHA